MMLSESVVEAERLRLPGRERVSSTTGLSGGGGFLFGLVFVVVGISIVLVGLKVIVVDPATVHAPYWVLSMAGLAFALGGTLFWVMVSREQSLLRKRQIPAPAPSYAQACADYPWNPQGISRSPWRAVANWLLIMLFLAIFLTPFNWWAWGAGDGGLLVKFIVSLFDLVLCYCAVSLVLGFLAALKYGQSRLEYGTFPLHVGARADLMWFPPSGLQDVARITFVLRCVEEWTERRGTAGDRSVEVVHEQLWAARRTSAGIVVFQPERPLPLSFDIPATVPGSKLADKQKIIFWELDISAEATGIDFQEQYLVPLYAPGV